MRAEAECAGGADALIAALREIGGPVCLAAADAVAGARGGGVDLHLRRAGLDDGAGRRLSAALLTCAAVDLRSFSASYNPGLTDAGAAALVDAFPASVTELGMVGCALGDAGGRAILAWAERAARVRMICVEANSFSADMRARFAALGQRRPGMLVVV